MRSFVSRGREEEREKERERERAMFRDIRNEYAALVIHESL